MSDSGGYPQTLQQVTLQIIHNQAPQCSRVLNNKTLQLCATVPNGTKGDYLLLFDLYLINLHLHLIVFD